MNALQETSRNTPQEALAQVICSKAGRQLNPTKVYLNTYLEENKEVAAEFKAKVGLVVIRATRTIKQRVTRVQVLEIVAIENGEITFKEILVGKDDYSQELVTSKYWGAIETAFLKVENGNTHRFYKSNLFHSDHKNAPVLVRAGQVVG